MKFSPDRRENPVIAIVKKLQAARNFRCNNRLQWIAGGKWI